jgi:prepilin signal peptidase PulO-like enzyme (type II secretory pathway)
MTYGLMQDRLPIALAAGLLGWGLGWASAWLSGWLHPSEQSEHGSLRRGLVPDPLVQGASALVWACIPLLVAGDWLRWAETGLLTLPLIQVAVTDLRTIYVYTVVAAIGLALGLAFGWQVHHVDWWWSFAGAAGGAVAFGGLYLLGRVLYRGREAMARGDIGIAAMVGAGAAACTAQALFVGIFVSGVLAIGILLVTRSRGGSMPYGPGLCLGGLITLFWC